MALEVILNRKGAYRLVLEEYPEDVYVLVYDTREADYDSPSEDHLQDDWVIAKRSAMHKYGVADDAWREIPDTKFNG